MNHRKSVRVAVMAFVASSLASAQLRPFTNDNGTVIQAGLVSHNGDKVKLKRADGKEFEVIPAIFSDEDEAYIKKWMTNTPATKNYNLRVTTTKKKIEGASQNMGYKRVKNDLWSYVISITNDSQDSVTKLTVKYRVFSTNSAEGSYSSSDQVALHMIEGRAEQNAELGFNRTLEVTTTPVKIDLVDYEYGSRYKDSLKGCLVRIVDQDDKVVLDWVSPEVSMKGKDWLNTNPAPGGGKSNPAVIR